MQIKDYKVELKQKPENFLCRLFIHSKILFPFFRPHILLPFEETENQIYPFVETWEYLEKSPSEEVEYWIRLFSAIFVSLSDGRPYLSSSIFSLTEPFLNLRNSSRENGTKPFPLKFHFCKNPHPFLNLNVLQSWISRKSHIKSLLSSFACFV